MLKKFAITKDV